MVVAVAAAVAIVVVVVVANDKRTGSVNKKRSVYCRAFFYG
jgi:hypothetical protein